MSETIFTKIIKREIPANIVYEDENHIAFLDIMPFEKGHTLVVPKKPFETIHDMSEFEFLELMKVVKKIAAHIAKELNCGINLWQNNGKISGQEIPHVHVHVVPRREAIDAYVKTGEKYLGNEAKNYTDKLRLN